MLDPTVVGEKPLRSDRRKCDFEPLERRRCAVLVLPLSQCQKDEERGGCGGGESRRRVGEEEVVLFAVAIDLMHKAINDAFLLGNGDCKWNNKPRSLQLIVELREAVVVIRVRVADGGLRFACTAISWWQLVEVEMLRTRG